MSATNETLSRADMMLLMQWADGEANGETAARAEALIAKNGDAREFVRELHVVADSIRDVTELAPTKFDVADNVMTRIQAEQGAVVHSLAEERARRKRVGAFVAAGLALAASVAFVLRPDGPAAGVPSQLAVNTLVAPPGASGSASAAAGAYEEPEVHVVGGTGVSVFYVQDSQAAAASVVVWVSEESEP